MSLFPQQCDLVKKIRDNCRKYDLITIKQCHSVTIKSNDVHVIHVVQKCLTTFWSLFIPACCYGKYKKVSIR